jgi:broad specificity phosphatase PhoE
MRSDQSDAENKEEGGEDDNGKRQARLMRNRESAQLSRQRKKVYVSELEGRLRTMAATVAELNATISHLTAENVNLRRQLGYYYPPPGESYFLCAEF